jgi:hypothetical protein
MTDRKLCHGQIRDLRPEIPVIGFYGPFKNLWKGLGSTSQNITKHLLH